MSAAQATACRRRVGVERHAERELVRRRQQDGAARRARPPRRRRSSTAIEVTARPLRRDQLAVQAVAVAPRPRRCGAAGAQHGAQQPQRLAEAGADDDPRRLHRHPADAREVAGELLAELRQPARVAVAERRVGRHRQRPARRRQPGRAREGAEVGHAGPQVEPHGGLDRARGAGSAAAGVGPLGDPRARPLARDEPALGDELGVRLGHRVARDPEVGGERPRRRQPAARRQPAGPHRLAQLVLEPRAHRRRPVDRRRSGPIAIELALTLGPIARYGRRP